MDAAPPVPAAGRRFRLRLAWAIALLLALAVAAAVIAALVVSRSYGPLDAQGGSFSPSDPTGRKAATVDRIGMGTAAFVIDARRPGSHTFSFDVQNTGRLPLTLDALSVDRHMVARFTKLEITEAGALGQADERPSWIPVEGATIEAGEYRAFRATITWDRFCGDPDPAGGEWLGLAGIPVRYGYGPFSRDQTLALSSDLVLYCGPIPKNAAG